MSTYTLNYFNIRGRAECSRLIFYINDVKFEDNRIPMSEWPTFKESFTFRQIPVLEVDGHQICQSDAIARFLAKRYGLTGENEFEDADIDAAAGAMSDIMDKMTILYFNPDEDFKTKTRPEIVSQIEGLERFLAKNEHKSGYLVGKKMSWVDLKLYDMLCIFPHWLTDPLVNCPLLCALRDKIGEEPKVKEWVGARKTPEIPNI